MPPTSSNTPQAPEPKVRLYAKHSLLTRSLHWLNMVAIGALIATGIAMMVGGDRLESIGGSIHEVFYFLLFGVGAVYLISLIAGGGWKLFLPTRSTLADATDVVKSELKMGSHKPRLQKYNGAQRLAYGAVLLMVAGEVVTGLAMAYRHELPWLGALLGGRHAVHSIHKLLMFGIIAFIVVHVAQVIRAGWPTLRSMISGYDVVPAGNAAAIDGAIPEPDRLCTPVAQSAARKTVNAQTRQGFVSAAAAAATGLVLLALGSSREAGASAPQQHRSRAASGGSDDGGAPAGPGSDSTAAARADLSSDNTTAKRRARRRAADGGDDDDDDDDGGEGTRGRRGRAGSTDRRARGRSRRGGDGEGGRDDD
jgi:thiosulfate reductase cytochrome b subunit